jgi:hypothetical protein
MLRVVAREPDFGGEVMEVLSDFLPFKEARDLVLQAPALGIQMANASLHGRTRHE